MTAFEIFQAAMSVVSVVLVPMVLYFLNSSKEEKKRLNKIAESLTERLQKVEQVYATEAFVREQVEKESLKMKEDIQEVKASVKEILEALVDLRVSFAQQGYVSGKRDDR